MWTESHLDRLHGRVTPDCEESDWIPYAARRFGNIVRRARPASVCRMSRWPEPAKLAWALRSWIVPGDAATRLFTLRWSRCDTASCRRLRHRRCDDRVRGKRSRAIHCRLRGSQADPAFDARLRRLGGSYRRPDPCGEYEHDPKKPCGSVWRAALLGECRREVESVPVRVSQITSYVRHGDARMASVCCGCVQILTSGACRIQTTFQVVPGRAAILSKALRSLLSRPRTHC